MATAKKISKTKSKRKSKSTANSKVKAALSGGVTDSAKKKNEKPIELVTGQAGKALDTWTAGVTAIKEIESRIAPHKEVVSEFAMTRFAELYVAYLDRERKAATQDVVNLEARVRDRSRN